jgi:hypothetical protein
MGRGIADMKIIAAIVVCIAIALGLVSCAAVGFYPGSAPYSPRVFTGAGA